MGGWKGVCEQPEMSACICRQNNVVAKAKKIKYYFFSILKCSINCGGKKYCPNRKNKNVNPHLHQTQLAVIFSRFLAVGIMHNLLLYSALKEAVVVSGSNGKNGASL